MGDFIFHGANTDLLCEDKLALSLLPELVFGCEAEQVGNFSEITDRNKVRLCFIWVFSTKRRSSRFKKNPPEK